MASFTNQISEPTTTAFQAVQRSFNSEVDTSTGALIGNLGKLASGGATLMAEIGAADLGFATETALTDVIEQSVQDPDFFNKVRSELSLPSTVSNTTAGRLKQQSILTRLKTEAGSNLRKRAAVDAAAKNVLGISPTAGILNSQEQIEVDNRRAATATLARRVTQARANGFVGTDSQVLNAATLIAQSGVTLSAANTAGKSAGSISSGTYRANLQPVFNQARDSAVVFAGGPLMNMLEAYSTASKEDKAVLAAAMGNEITNVRANIMRTFNREDGGVGLSPKELDYIMSPVEAMFQQLGTTLGLTQGDLTEEKALKQLNEQAGFGLGLMKTTILTDMLKGPAVQKLMVARELGGDVFAGRLLKLIPDLSAELEDLSDSSGKSKSSMVNNTLDYLTTGNREETADIYQKMVDQKISLKIITDVDPKVVESPQVLENVSNLVIGGILQDKTVANQTYIVEVLSGGNGLATTRAVLKSHPDAGKQMVNFFIKTSHRSYAQAVEELAHKAKELETPISTEDGKFSLKATDLREAMRTGYSDIKEYIDKANHSLDLMMKYKDFTTSSKTGEVTVRKGIITSSWDLLQRDLAKSEKTSFFKFNVPPKQYAETSSWFKSMTPFYMWTEEEKAAVKVLYPSIQLKDVLNGVKVDKENKIVFWDTPDD